MLRGAALGLLGLLAGGARAQEAASSEGSCDEFLQRDTGVPGGTTIDLNTPEARERAIGPHLEPREALRTPIQLCVTDRAHDARQEALERRNEFLLDYLVRRPEARLTKGRRSYERHQARPELRSAIGDARLGEQRVDDLTLRLGYPNVLRGSGRGSVDRNDELTLWAHTNRLEEVVLCGRQ